MEERMGFKEWQVVCDALASGRQKVILRKGGIHEGRAGFSFAHEEFYLFPTRFHATADQICEGDPGPASPEWKPGDVVRITHKVRAVKAVTLTDWQEIAALSPLHIYTEKTVRDRFHWEGKGMPSSSLHVAFVEVEALHEPWEFPYEPKYGGCRSWVKLPCRSLS